MNEHDQKHLTLSNRTYIEQELLQKSSFASISKVLHKHPTTIAKEVKNTTKPFLLNKITNTTYVGITKIATYKAELKCPSYSNRYCTFYCKKNLESVFNIL